MATVLPAIRLTRLNSGALPETCHNGVVVLACAACPLSAIMYIQTCLRSRLISLLVLASLTCFAAAKKDLWKTLGVAKGCSSKELQKAWRKAALKHHPDKAPPDQRDKAERKFKEISHAYETLNDDNKRALYDQYGESALDPQFQPSPFSSSSSSGQQRSTHFSSSQHQGSMPDFFSFFQEGPTTSRRQSASFSSSSSFDGFSPSSGASGIDLQELFRKMMGGTPDTTGIPRRQQKPRRPPKQQSYTRNVSCTLEELATGSTKRLRVTHPIGDRVMEEMYVIELKPGWKAGTRVKFPARHGGYFPAMVFVVKEKPHSFLTWRDNDLFYQCEITQRQAERGAKIRIPLPTGEMFEVKSEGPMEDGHVMTVPHKGMPIRGGPQRGNLKISFKVIESSRHA